MGEGAGQEVSAAYARGTAVQMMDRTGCSESDEEEEGKGNMLICISLRSGREEVSPAEKDL